MTWKQAKSFNCELCVASEVQLKQQRNPLCKFEPFSAQPTCFMFSSWKKGRSGDLKCHSGSSWSPQQVRAWRSWSANYLFVEANASLFRSAEFISSSVSTRPFTRSFDCIKKRVISFPDSDLILCCFYNLKRQKSLKRPFPEIVRQDWREFRSQTWTCAHLKMLFFLKSLNTSCMFLLLSVSQ